MTKKWTISAYEVEKKKGKLSNVITAIHWRHEIEVDGTSAETYGCLPIDEPTSDSFIKFDEISEELVISWLESKLDLEAQLLAEIDFKKNPKSFVFFPNFVKNNDNGTESN